MAIIHSTTMSPDKLELLTSWLPDQPWYLETERVLELTVAGGFRLDDPQGEVGIEFMLVTDRSGERPTAYQVPLRAWPLMAARTRSRAWCSRLLNAAWPIPVISAASCMERPSTPPQVAFDIVG